MRTNNWFKSFAPLTAGPAKAHPLSKRHAYSETCLQLQTGPPMKKKVERSKWQRAFNSLCATLFIGSVIYIMVMGFSTVAMAAMAISVAGTAAPLVQSDEGILEILIGTLEAMIDGVVAIIKGIAGAIASLFG